MISDEIIKGQLNNVVNDVTLDDLNLGEKYEGKVRTNYTDKEKGIRTIIATDRLSAFDRVITSIPFKGQLLNQMSNFWFEKTKDIAPNHIIDVPDPNVVRVKSCKTYPIEMIVRAYITGSAWRAYEKGKLNDLYGITFPEGLKKNQKLEEPVITPTTKAKDGDHDEPISKEEILKQGLAEKDEYEKIEKMTMELFNFASEHCAKNNLILVDCKFEFGITEDGEIIVIDEIFTPDASRFWYLDTYQECFDKGEDIKNLDKEFFRQWLISEKNYMGDGEIPEIPDDIKVEFVKRYIESYELITGEEFKPAIEGNVMERIRKNLS